MSYYAFDKPIETSKGLAIGFKIEDKFKDKKFVPTLWLKMSEPIVTKKQCAGRITNEGRITNAFTRRTPEDFKVQEYIEYHRCMDRIKFVDIMLADLYYFKKDNFKRNRFYTDYRIEHCALSEKIKKSLRPTMLGNIFGI